MVTNDGTWCSSTGVTYTASGPSGQPLFRLEMDDAFVLRLIPLSDLARTIAEMWQQRDPGLTFEYRGRGPDEPICHPKHLQAVEVRLKPTFGLTDESGTGGHRRLTREQYWKCRDAITPTAPAPTPKKAAVRIRSTRRKRA